MTTPTHERKTLSLGVIVTYLFRDMADGTFWIDIHADGLPYGSLGPFEGEAARQEAHDEMTDLLRSQGAVDIPLKPQ